MKEKYVNKSLKKYVKLFSANINKLKDDSPIRIKEQKVRDEIQEMIVRNEEKHIIVRAISF